MEKHVLETRGVDLAPKPVGKWGYETHLKEYLLLLASKGPVSLEKTSLFPTKIELGKTWHETLNDMRETTASDEIEKWAFAGVKAEKRGIFLPTIPIKGNRDYVSSETMKRMIGWAREKQGIVDFLGDIHSHPMDLATSFVNKAASKVLSLDILIETFSASDFYHFITWPGMYFMAVVAGGHNIFAFKAKESLGLGVSTKGFSQDEFEKYWYEKFGYKYLGSAKKFGANRGIPISPKASQTKMNIAIARKHHLLIYQGRKDKDLVRVFPR